MPPPILSEEVLRGIENSRGLLMWLWIMIGLGCFLALSLLVAGAVAATLGAIGRKISDLHMELHEAPEGRMAPSSRVPAASDEPAGAEPEVAVTPALRLHAH